MTMISASLFAVASVCLPPRFHEREWIVEELDVPTSSSARWPHLGQDGATGAAWLTWTEKNATGHALMGASLEAESWSPVRTFAAGASWFVNWADVPRIAARGPRVMVTWLDRLGQGTYAYGVRFSISGDGGGDWSAPRLLHEDDSPTEHGFASLVALVDGGFAATWLDGRAMGGAGHSGEGGHGSAGGHGAMSLRTRHLQADGRLGKEVLLDDRVCECCPTDMVALSDGTLVVAYRDRSEDEVRDIVVQAGRSNEPDSWQRSDSAADGWLIPGCPVNGPSLSAHGNRVALAWYTGAGGRARVRLALSNEGATAFGEPVDVEEVNALGRVQVVHMDAGAAVCWMDLDPDQGASWLLRYVGEDLSLGEPIVLGAADGDRQAGYPTMERVGDRLLCAFTDTEYGEGIRVLSIRER